MARRSFGLAGAIEPGRKIFYESLFSQFQIGRLTDLLCAVAAEAGVEVPSLRLILNAALNEACRCQGLFNTSLGALDPVTVELGADSVQGALSVQFTVDGALALSEELAQALFASVLPARELVFKVDTESRRAEISCFVPLDFGAGKKRDPAEDSRAEPRFELLSADDAESDEAKAAGTPNEYVELGDVEYETFISTEPGVAGAVREAGGEETPEGTTAAARRDPTRKILQAARKAANEVAEETVAGVDSAGPDDQTVVGASETDADSARLVKGGATEKELARVLASGLPEEEIARLVKGAMSEEELAQVVTGGLPDEDLAQIVKGSSTPEELQELVKFSSDKEKLAETVIRGSTKEDAAELIKASFGESEIGEAITTALSKERLADLAADALPPEELLRFARDNVAPDRFVQTVKDSFSPQQLAGFAAQAMKSPEVCKAVLTSLSPTEIAQSLKTVAPQKLAEATKAQVSQMSSAQIAEILSNGLPREEYAKMVAASIPRSEFSRILSEGLPPQEMARSLYEGLPKDKFAQLLAASMPKEELAQVLASTGSSGPPLGPTQEILESAQVATLLAPELTRGEALSVLSAVLPQAAAESIFTGAIPKEEVTEAIKPYLPEPEMASMVAEKILEAKPAPEEEDFSDTAAEEATVASEPGAPTARPQRAVPASSVIAQTKTRETQAQRTEETKDAKDRPAVSAQAPVQPAQDARKHSSAATATAAASTTAAAQPQGTSQRNAPAAYVTSPASAASAATQARTAPAPSFDAERARLEKTFQAKLGTVQKSVEFYLARAKNLETQLRTSEEAKRAAEREAQAAKAGMEKFIEETYQPETITPKSAGDGEPSRERGAKDGAGARKSVEKALERPGTGVARKEVEKGPTASEAKAARDREAMKFFQKKAREFEQELRAAESEVRRLTAEHAKELLKVSKEKEREKEKEIGKEAQTPRSESVGAPKSTAQAAARSAPAVAGTAQTPQPRQAQEKQRDPALDEKIKRLEAKVRIVEQEKERLQEQLQRRETRDKAEESRAPETSSRSEPVDSLVGETEARKTISAPTSASESEPTSEPATASASVPRPADPVSGEPSSKDSKDDENVDVSEKIDATNLEVERGMDGIASKLERLKENIPDGAVRRTVDGLMTSVMQEKAKLMEASKEMGKSLRKKELSFKNREAMLTESLKQLRGTADQRQAAIDRMKQQMAEIQQKADRSAQSQSQSGSNETQIRMKYEQSQRQIELLNKEIEKANRRLQQTPQSQGSNLAQERMLAEMKKQIDNANKAVTAKKQELEAVKAQLHERDRREEQYKRQVMKLQGDLMAARTSAKKAS